MIFDVLDIIATVTGISGLVMSLLSYHRSCVYSVHEYLSKVESDELIEVKQYVYNHNDFDVKDPKAAIIVNFFHHWGMLAKRKYLPM